MSGESLALKVTNKINSRLKYLHSKNKILTPALRRLLCNALIQPHFDCASSAWYPNLTQKMKNKIQITQNKCIRYCLQLEKWSYVIYHMSYVIWVIFPKTSLKLLTGYLLKTDSINP